MTTIEKLQTVKRLVDDVMKINQSLKTPLERQEAGFHQLYEAQQQLEWAIDELKPLYNGIVKA